MSLARAALLLLVAASAAACGPTFNVNRMMLLQPRPAGCRIDWVNVPSQSLYSDASAWAIVGLVEYRGRGTFTLTSEITEQTNREACALGADAVSLGGVNQGEFFAASFYALQRKAGQPQPPAPAPTPTTPL